MKDWREDKACPKCGAICGYDGWDHVHSYTGVGIGSCADITQPTQVCKICARREVVVANRQGAMPYHSAVKRLAERCKEAGHESLPILLTGNLVSMDAYSYRKENNKE